MRSEEAFQESVRSMRHQTLRADRAGDYWTDDEKNRLRILFDSGVGITEIALELGRKFISRSRNWTCMVVSKTRSDKETAKSLLSAYVVAVEMIRHYARFGNSAQQKRRTENV